MFEEEEDFDLEFVNEVERSFREQKTTPDPAGSVGQVLGHCITSSPPVVTSTQKETGDTGSSPLSWPSPVRLEHREPEQFHKTDDNGLDQLPTPAVSGLGQLPTPAAASGQRGSELACGQERPGLVLKRPAHQADHRLTDHGKRPRLFPGPAGLLPRLAPGDQGPVPSDGEQGKVQEQRGEGGGGDKVELTEVWRRAEQELRIVDKNGLADSFTTRWIRAKVGGEGTVTTKMPLFLCKVAKLDLSRLDPLCLLLDKEGEVEGNIHRDVMEGYGQDVQDGSVLLLRNVVVLLIAKKKYVNITTNNLVKIYSEEPQRVRQVRRLTKQEVEAGAKELERVRQLQIRSLQSQSQGPSFPTQGSTSTLHPETPLQPLVPSFSGLTTPSPTPISPRPLLTEPTVVEEFTAPLPSSHRFQFKSHSVSGETMRGVGQSNHGQIDSVGQRSQGFAGVSQHALDHTDGAGQRSQGFAGVSQHALDQTGGAGQRSQGVTGVSQHALDHTDGAGQRSQGFAGVSQHALGHYDGAGQRSQGVAGVSQHVPGQTGGEGQRSKGAPDPSQYLLDSMFEDLDDESFFEDF